MLVSVGDVLGVLDGLGIPATHLVWPGLDPPPLPYAVLVPHESRNRYGDGRVRHRARRYDVELYARVRDVALEQAVQSALDAAEVAYSSDVAMDEDNQYVITYFSMTLTEQEASDGS